MQVEPRIPFDPDVLDMNAEFFHNAVKSVDFMRQRAGAPPVNNQTTIILTMPAGECQTMVHIITRLAYLERLILQNTPKPIQAAPIQLPPPPKLPEGTNIVRANFGNKSPSSPTGPRVA